MSQKIIFCKGLPASGKSTWSKQFCKDNPEFVRINKDDIRELLGSPEFSSRFEKDVLTIQHLMGEAILRTGKSLIVDDTNFAEKHEIYWRSIAHVESIEFEIKTFDTPVEECIKRDSEREKSVGKRVILGMYNQYLKPKDSE